MKEDFDYFLIKKTGEFFIPYITLANDGTSDSLFMRKKVENPPTIRFYLNKPVPKTLGPVDFMTCPYLIFSDKIASVLNPLNLYKIQLIPGVLIEEKTNEPYQGAETNYWGLQLYNRIKAVDLEQSIVDIDVGINKLEKLVLDKKILQEIPIEERLVFKLKEDSSFEFFHKSIVEKVKEVNPSNMEFVHVDDITGL